MTTFELLARAKGGEGVKSGPIGLAVILVLCIAAYFLFKSMSKHLKRVRENFPDDTPKAGTADGARQPAPTAPESGSTDDGARSAPPSPPAAPPPPQPPDAAQ